MALRRRYARKIKPLYEMVHYVIKIVLTIFTEISRCQLCSTLHHILTRETDPSPQAYLRL